MFNVIIIAMRELSMTQKVLPQQSDAKGLGKLYSIRETFLITPHFIAFSRTEAGDFVIAKASPHQSSYT